MSAVAAPTADQHEERACWECEALREMQKFEERLQKKQEWQWENKERQ